MRDSHRLKEKFDVSLDNRQIVSLLIVGIIVLGAVFVLGVVVGKKLAGNAQTAAAPDLLSALDANAQALQQARETEPSLTFQDELTRHTASEPSAAAAPKPSKPGTVTVAIPPPAPKPKPTEPTPAPTAAGNPEDEAPPPSATDDDYAPTPSATTARAPEARPTEPKPTESKPAAGKPTEPKVTESKPASSPGKVESTPVPTRTTTPAGGMKEAIARATQRPTEAVPGGAFTLQISAFQNQPEAERFAARLRDKGYAPFIVATEIPKKGTWYRVRMGSFPSKEAASRYLSDFKRETQIDAFVAGVN